MQENNTNQEQKTINLQQFLSAMMETRLSVYREKENFEARMKQFYDLSEKLAQYALEAEGQIKALAGENMNLKKKIEELETEVKENETRDPVTA